MTLPDCKVVGAKVYPRQTWNFRSHAVSACIGLWHHRPMHAPCRLMHANTGCIAPWQSQADECSYCMGPVVLILSQIYLYLQLLCPDCPCSPFSLGQLGTGKDRFIKRGFGAKNSADVYDVTVKWRLESCGIYTIAKIALTRIFLSIENIFCASKCTCLLEQ